MHDAAPIDWSYTGKPDLSAGTGATDVERRLPLLAGLGLTAWVATNVVLSGTDWTLWQWAVALLLAFDLGGGAVANHLNSCKRFYHSPLRPDEGRLVAVAKSHWLFTALHLHTVIVAALWGSSLLVGAAWYFALLLAGTLVHQVPLYLARPVAAAVVTAAIAVSFTAPGPEHLEWLVPILFLKIVLGHAVREEPYRPGAISKL